MKPILLERIILGWRTPEFNDFLFCETTIHIVIANYMVLFALITVPDGKKLTVGFIRATKIAQMNNKIKFFSRSRINKGSQPGIGIKHDVFMNIGTNTKTQG